MNRISSARLHAAARQHGAMRPGITENALWAELHHGNIAGGGEWIETRTRVRRQSAKSTERCNGVRSTSSCGASTRKVLGFPLSRE